MKLNVKYTIRRCSPTDLYDCIIDQVIIPRELHYFNILFPGDVFTVLSNPNKYDIHSGLQAMASIPNKYYQKFYDPIFMSNKENHTETYLVINGHNLPDGSGNFTYEVEKCILHKRPFYNWFRFIWVLITKKYN